MALTFASPIIQFTEHVQVHPTMKFEMVYHENLRLDIEEKWEMLQACPVKVWMFLNGSLVGESYYEILDAVAEGEDAVPGVKQFMEAVRNPDKWLYASSTTIIPQWQKHGYGRILKAYCMALAKARGYEGIIGHAGKSKALNAEFGAEFLQEYPDWYGTGESYWFYKTRLH